MSTLLITSTNPGLLAGGTKLPDAIAVQGQEHHPVLEPMEFCTVESVHARAETLTLLLKEILDYRPAPHCGLYE